ncbi:MAG: helix-turn-helix transcriptional regulator [Gammaproteobacteria bacterium]
METLSSLSHRQQALLRHLLYSDQGLTLDQLADLLGISRNAVTQHISVLEKLDCIKSRTLPSAGGRPSRAYTLTDAGMAIFPKQYALFSTMLLKAISENLKGADLENLLGTIGRELALPFMDRVKNSGNEIEEVRKIMEELGYETRRGSAKKNASEIVAKNCVFHDLAVENPAVCELDRSLISSLLEKKIEQKECMVKGGDSCRFCISKT